MSKVSGAYESVVRGVSQQVPQDRLSGQHTEQVNMVSDPVRGLARRHGSVTVAEARLPNSYADLLANTSGHRVYPFSSSGEDIDLIYRAALRSTLAEHEDALFCFNRSAKQFIPVVIHDTVATQALRRAGVSAITQLGRFVVMAGNAYTTTWTTTPQWESPSNQSRLAVWIRGGAYSRTYTVTLTERLTGSKTTISYKTFSSSYPELLDTTDLLTSDTDYQKKVNDRVNAYNGKVTEWIGKAAEDIVPANIAAKLKEQYDLLGYGACTVVGSTLVIDNGRWSEVAVDDGGDNSMAEAVGNVIEAAEGACPVHFVGKIVKVRPSKESPDSAYYLEAHPKDDVSTGITEVTWREGGASKVMPARMLVLATLYEGVLYVSDDSTWLEARVNLSEDDDIPVYKPRVVGDDVTNPLPNFFGQRIDFLAVMQDRLIVGAGAVITASRVGDYFNFFRSSVLTIKDDDPFEIYSLGSEEDVIKYATPFNRDLVLYGNRGQYLISGRQVLTPKTASIVTVSNYGAAIDASPQATGNLVFYASKRGPETKRATALFQIQPAALSDNPESTDVSQQLSGYIRGTAMELVTATSPNTVVLRTDYTRNGLYLYNYLDRADNGQRVMDAWHRWAWSPILGHVMGIATNPEGDLFVYMVRKGVDGAAWIACERFTLTGSTSVYPYLDGIRASSATGSLTTQDLDQMALAFGSGVADAWLGGTLSAINRGYRKSSDFASAYRGVLYGSYVIPTNPFPKDREGKAITFGRLTLGKVRVSVAETGGATIEASRYGEVYTLSDFNGFKVDSPSAKPGTQPISTATIQGHVGGEVRECSYSIRSKRWLPLTVTSIEWAGQIFNRERRA